MFSGSAGSSGQLTNAPCSSEDLSQALTQECGDDDDLEDVPMEDWPTQVLAEFIQRKRPKVGHDCVAMLQASLAIPPDENVTESEVQEKAELVKVKIREADDKFGKKVQSALRLRERFLECWYNRGWDKFKGLLSDFSKISMCRQLLAEENKNRSRINSSFFVHLACHTFSHDGSLCMNSSFFVHFACHTFYA